VVAQQAGGEPYFVHRIAAALLAKLPEGATSADVASVTDAALRDPADPWSLRAYIADIDLDYRSDADIALAALDVLAERRGDLAVPELVELIVRGRRERISESHVRMVLRSLDDDQYVALQRARVRFALPLLQRAWTAGPSPRTNPWVRQDLLAVRLRRAVTAALRGDVEVLNRLSASERELAEQILAQISTELR
jgi:hypothetical protein